MLLITTLYFLNRMEATYHIIFFRVVGVRSNFESSRCKCDLQMFRGIKSSIKILIKVSLTWLCVLLRYLGKNIFR